MKPLAPLEQFCNPREAAVLLALADLLVKSQSPNSKMPPAPVRRAQAAAPSPCAAPHQRAQARS